MFHQMAIITYNNLLFKTALSAGMLRAQHMTTAYTVNLTAGQEKKSWCRMMQFFIVLTFKMSKNTNSSGAGTENKTTICEYMESERGKSRLTLL